MPISHALHPPIEWKTQSHIVDYPEALAWMQSRVGGIQEGKASPCVWLLEHPALYTLGTSADDADVLKSAEFPLFKTGRGGQVTYHGPGQRVAYVMVDLKAYYQDIRRYVFELEEWVIQTLHHFGIQGERRSGRIGIWVDKNGKDKKIAAIGVRVQKWVTSHGFALNIDPDLSAYKHIVPCGLKDYGVTSLHDLGVRVSQEEVDQVIRRTCPFEP